MENFIFCVVMVMTVMKMHFLKKPQYEVDQKRFLKKNDLDAFPIFFTDVLEKHPPRKKRLFVSKSQTFHWPWNLEINHEIAFWKRQVMKRELFCKQRNTC